MTIDDAALLFVMVSPLLCGLAVWLAKPPFALQLTDRLEAWSETHRGRLRGSTRWLVRYLVYPVLFAFDLPLRLTKKIGREPLRSGVRVAVMPYAAGIIAYATMIYLHLVFAFGCFYVMYLVWGFFLLLFDREKASSTVLNPVLSRVRGSRLVKEGWLFETDTGTYIDDDGRVMERGLLWDTFTGTRIDEDGRVKKQGFFGETPTGYKIDEHGRTIKEGVLLDSPTGDKVDEHGRVVKEGTFFDESTGYRYKK